MLKIAIYFGKQLTAFENGFYFGNLQKYCFCAQSMGISPNSELKTPRNMYACVRKKDLRLYQDKCDEVLKIQTTEAEHCPTSVVYIYDV